MNWTVLIAVAALLFSLASPIASEWIRGHYRLKEKQLDADLELRKKDQEFYAQHRAEVIETFLRAAGKAIKSTTRPAVEDFGEAAGEIYMYVDKSLWHYIEAIIDNIPDGDLEDAESSYAALCKKLSNEHVRSEYQPEPDRRHKQKADRV